MRYYASKIGVTYNRITIRCQRTRWASCSSKGNLNFNCLLALFLIEIIDSVVVHELCHRKHMNHSPQFYDEIEKVFPGYKRYHKWLSDNGGVTVVALYDKAQTLPIPDMYGKNLIFKTGGVDGCDCDEVLSLIAEGKIDTTPLITHRFALKDIEKAYDIFEISLTGLLRLRL